MKCPRAKSQARFEEGSGLFFSIGFYHHPTLTKNKEKTLIG
jgi:hypothetical protein